MNNVEISAAARSDVDIGLLGVRDIVAKLPQDAVDIGDCFPAASQLVQIERQSHVCVREKQKRQIEASGDTGGKGCSLILAE